MSDEVRALVQGGTLFLATVSLGLSVLLLRLRVLAWRSIIMPAIVMAEIAVFYMVLVVIGPALDFSIGAYANFISAVIRFQSVAVVTSYLSFAVYKELKRRRQNKKRAAM